MIGKRVTPTNPVRSSGNMRQREKAVFKIVKENGPTASKKIATRLDILEADATESLQFLYRKGFIARRSDNQYEVTPEYENWPTEDIKAEAD